MTQPSDRELCDAWHDQPAPLLPILHAFQERDGFLSRPAIEVICKSLRIPLADLFSIVKFYHFFVFEPEDRDCAWVCGGPICRLLGADDLQGQLVGGARLMPCAGRCDDPVPVLARGDTLIAQRGKIESRVSPLPAVNPAAASRAVSSKGGASKDGASMDGEHFEECVFSSIRTPGRASLAGYRQTDGYEGLSRILGAGDPGSFVEELIESGLAGRGGAAFPTGVKWRAVAEAAGHPKTIVCNADEGEPGCFKDRAILDHDPHSVLEGMTLAACVTGAERGFIYLRYEYPQTQRILEKAISEATQAGYLGNNILGTGSNFEVYVRRGAGAYICGEEGSLLNSLEGKYPFPRNRPPFPVTHGFENLPTVVNNVETLAAASHIARRGARWYQSLGLGDEKGTKVISLSGDIRRPGNYEVPFGLPLQTLLHDWAGGLAEGRTLQAVTMAGLSGGFLAGDDLDVTLDEACIRSKGSFLGAGGIMVFDDRRDMVQVATEAMSFFADESCGKCFPCRIGTQRLTERLEGKAGPRQFERWQSEVHQIGKTMMATCACGLGKAAPLITESLLRYFPDDVASRLSR